MPKQKRSNRANSGLLPDLENSFQSLLNSFKQKIDSMSFSPTHRSSFADGSSDAEKRVKELEAKERELDLLRQENELLKERSHIVDTRRIESGNASTFLFKDVEESLVQFSGDDGYSIEKWLNDMNETALCLGWSDMQKTVYAKRLLTGTAKLSLRTTNDVSTWEKLSQFLKQEFKVILNSAQLHLKLAERKKLPSESYRSYLREIGCVSNVEDDAIIQYCIDGIPDLETNKQLLYGWSNMEDFKRKLDAYAELKKKCKPSSILSKSANPKDVQSSSRFRGTSSKNISRCYGCGEVGHISRQCPNKEKGLKCFKCHSFGHRANECSERDKYKACLTKDQSQRCSNEVKRFTIGKFELHGLVDTGSDLNFMTQKKFVSIGEPNFEAITTSFSGAGSRNLKTLGQFSTAILIDGDEYHTVFHIVHDGIFQVDVILGKKLLLQTVTTISSAGITMKKFVPEAYSFIVEYGKLDLKLDHIENRQLIGKINSLIVNYCPLKFQSNPEIEMKVILMDEKPISQKVRRLSPLETEIVRNQINEWLDEKNIRPSKSDYASPIVLSNKKDGTKRLCVDYRQLNKIVVKDKYPLPLIDDQIDQLRGAKYFCTLDLRN